MQGPALDTFLIFLMVGLLAQAIDGALGMAYGVVSSSVLLAFGVPPATASASVHGAELFTTAASATSHAWHGNIDWRLFVPLAVGGVLGGVTGAYILAGIDGDRIKPVIIAYLALVGVWILWRASRGFKPRQVRNAILVAPLGMAGGFLDAIGGGGWGPTVTSTLVGAGQAPRKAIGTANTAEFFLTAAISATFVWSLVTGHWREAEDLRDHLSAIAGLIIGGLIAAPFAGLITKRVPARALTYGVGSLLICLALFQGFQLAGVVA